MVNLAPGPCGKMDGSYEFLGTSDSYIEFPNTAGGPLDVRKSITMLCWLNYGGQDGPIFNYTTSGSWEVHLWIVQGKLFVRFNRRDYSHTNPLIHTPHPMTTVPVKPSFGLMESWFRQETLEQDWNWLHRTASEWE